MGRFADRIRSNQTLKRLRSQRAVVKIEYALLAGLLVLAIVISLAAFGSELAAMFFNTNKAMAGVGQAAPAIDVTATTKSAHPSGAVAFKWHAVGADSVSATASMSGTCPAAGSSPALGWGGSDGSASIAWSDDYAGCGIAVTMTAKNIRMQASGTASATFAIANVTPTDLAFAEATGVNPGASEISSEQTVDGVERPSPISVTDGMVSVDGSPFAPAASAPNGSSVQLQGTAPAGFAQTKSIVFQAGSATGVWKITTRARDLAPAPYSFLVQGKAAPGALVSSLTSAPLAGFDGPLPVTATNGAEVSVDGNGWGASGTVEASAGDRIGVRLAAPAGADGNPSTTTTVTIGDTSADFTATTIDSTPDGFTFPTIAKADPGETIDLTATSVLSGFDGPLTVTATNGALVSTDGAAWKASGALQVNPGDILHVRLTASNAVDGTGTSATTVSIGGTSASASVTTRDEAPDAFQFPAIAKAQPGATVTMESAAALSGFDDALTATASNGALVSTDGISFAASASVSAGQNLWVRFTASSASDGTGTASTVVTVGLASATASADTVDLVPAAFSFQVPAKADPSAAVPVATTAALDGFDGDLAVTTTNGALVSTDGSAWHASGALRVSKGQTLWIQLTAASAHDGTGAASATATVGGVSAIASVATKDLTPNAFDLGSATYVASGSWQISNQVTLAGFDGPATLSFTSTGNGMYRTMPSSSSAWSAWTALADTTVNAGDVLQVEEQASATVHAVNSLTAKVATAAASASDTYTVMTKGAGCAASAVSWTYKVTGQKGYEVTCDGNVSAHADGTSAAVSAGGKDTNSGNATFDCDNGSWVVRPSTIQCTN